MGSKIFLNCIKIMLISLGVSGCVPVKTLLKQTDEHGSQIKIEHYLNRANHIVNITVRQDKLITDHYTLYDNNSENYFITKTVHWSQPDSIREFLGLTDGRWGTCQFLDYSYPPRSCGGRLPGQLIKFSARDSSLIALLIMTLNKKGYTLFKQENVGKIVGWLPALHL